MIFYQRNQRAIFFLIYESMAFTSYFYQRNQRNQRAIFFLDSSKNELKKAINVTPA